MKNEMLKEIENGIVISTIIKIVNPEKMIEYTITSKEMNEKEIDLFQYKHRK